MLPLKSTDSIISAADVAISHAREGAAIYTDSRAKLTDALGLRDGTQIGAIDETMGRPRETGIRVLVRDVDTAIGM